MIKNLIKPPKIPRKFFKAMCIVVTIEVLINSVDEWNIEVKIPKKRKTKKNSIKNRWLNVLICQEIGITHLDKKLKCR